MLGLYITITDLRDTIIALSILLHITISMLWPQYLYIVQMGQHCDASQLIQNVSMRISVPKY